MRGSLAELAATGLASEPTLRKWIAAQPDRDWIIKRGKNGDAYEIDFDGATEAWRAEEAEKLVAARRRAEDIRQFGLELGLGATDADTAVLSIAERKQLLEEELVAMKVAERRGALVWRAEVEATIGDVLLRFRERGATFAARLAKRIDLTRDQITAIERLSLDDQRWLADMMENWSPNGGNPSDGSGAAVDDPAVSIGR